LQRPQLLTKKKMRSSSRPLKKKKRRRQRLRKLLLPLPHPLLQVHLVRHLLEVNPRRKRRRRRRRKKRNFDLSLSWVRTNRELSFVLQPRVKTNRVMTFRRVSIEFGTLFVDE